MISFYYRSKEQEGEMKVIIVVDNSMFLYGSEIAYQHQKINMRTTQ